MSRWAQMMGAVLMLAFTVGCGGGAPHAYRADSSMERAPSASAGASLAGAEPTDKKSRKLIRDADLTLEVSDEDDIEPAVKQIAEMVEPLKGYVVSQTTKSVTIKVPSDRLDEALKMIQKVGEVTRRQVRTRDVTAQYADLMIRIDNLKTLQARLKELVAQGTNVAEILEVEKELSRVTGELERLEGQMRVLNNQTDFARITVRVEESVSPGPVGWIFYGLYRGVKWLFVWD
ncbi:MAG: DUF4349 domain-containing protein [Bradymonadia bacterium]